MDGSQIIKLLTYAAVLVAAIVIGNWFLNEAKKAKIKKEPWYKPYFSIPGIIILAALSLPILLWLLL
jgi:hypothetical protein